MNPRNQPFGLTHQDSYIAENTTARKPRILLAVFLGVWISAVGVGVLRYVVVEPIKAMPTATADIEAAYQRGLKAGLERPRTYNPISWQCK